MFVWALTLWMVVLWWEVCIIFMMFAMRSLSGWLYREDGFLVWLRSKYMLFRLSVDVNMFVASVLVCYMVSGST